MSNVKPGEKSDFAGLGALNELLMVGYRRKRQNNGNRAILREHQGISNRGKVQLDVNLHGELEFASLKARNALLSPEK